MGISPDVLARAAECDQDEASGSCVDELAAHRRTHPHQTVGTEHVLDSLDQQRQLTLENEVDLLLVLMRMYASSLARLEHDQVDPEAAHLQLAPQSLEALAAVAIELGERYVGLGHGASIGPPGCEANIEAVARFAAVPPRGAGVSFDPKCQLYTNHYYLPMIFKML